MEKIIIIGGKGSAVVLAEQIYDRQEKVGLISIGKAVQEEQHTV